MSSIFALVLTFATAAPAGQVARPAIYEPSTRFEAAIRGQSLSPTFSDPLITTPIQAPSGAPYNPFVPNPGNPVGPGQDPFLNLAPGEMPSYASPYGQQPYAPGGMYGVNGPQPYRLGWTPRVDAGYIGTSTVKAPGAGKLEVVEYGASLQYVTQLNESIIFSTTPKFQGRLLEGPGSPSLPGSLYKLGWDIALETMPAADWSFRMAFDPSINTDFQQGLGGDAYNFDGELTAFYRASPEFMFVLGVLYWDRVDQFILPNAGVVWTPDDRWEVRLLFPKSRISYFLGNFWNGSHWLYTSGEFHVESYQIEVPGAVSRSEQVQFQDWRLMLGLRSDHPTYEKFLEVGAVIGREVEYRRGTPGFDISDGFIARAGIRY